MQQKNRRGLRQNLIFAALVLALAAGLALWRQATAAPAPVAQLDYTGGPDDHCPGPGCHLRHR